MAANYPTPSRAADTIETHINRTIDGLIALLNLRRAQLIEQARDTREEKRAAQVARQEMQTQLTTARTHLLTYLKENPLQSVREKTVSEVEQKLRELRENTPAETELRWQCDTRGLSVSISLLGEILQVPVGLPNYQTFQLPSVATGKQGTGPGELNCPHGVAIDSATNHIFVANGNNNRIDIFSETGDCLSQLGVGQLVTPWGIAIHENSLFVSGFWQHAISKYSLTDFSLVRQIGKEGSGNGDFQYPRQLATDPSGNVFVADSGNDRICVFDTDLNHLRNIAHQAISHPYDITVSHNRIYVLCPYESPCMLVLSLEGHMLHSLISRGEGMDVTLALFFCLDANNNFVISDRGTHCIRVFSPAGNLLHSIGREGHQQGMLYEPYGVAVDTNGRLACVSLNNNFGLQIFC